MKRIILPFFIALLILSDSFSIQDFNQGVSYNITAEIFPSKHNLAFTSELSYTNNSPDTLKEIYLRLHWNIFKQDSYARNYDKDIAITDGVVIHSVNVNGQSAGYNVDNTILKIPLKDYLSRGETIKIKIIAEEEIPATWLRIGRSGRDYCAGHWFPAVCVYDKNGWQTDQYLGSGEFNEEIGDYNISLTLPESYLVFYTGSLLNAEEVLPIDAYRNLSSLNNNGIRTRIYNQIENPLPLNDQVRKTWEFHAENVRTFAFSAFENRIWDACKFNDVIINTVYNKTGEEFYIKLGMNAAKKSIEFFSNVLGKYPYPNLFITEAENIGGGMEYPGITFVQEAGNLLWDYFNASVIIHETGHNWCPMIINSNETSYAFMDEGVTEYFTGIAMEEFLGKENNYIYSSGLFKTIVPSTSIFNQNYSRVIHNDLEMETEPIITHSDRYKEEENYGINSYPRSVMVFRMLRYVMGDNAFLELFREYFKRYSFKHVYPQDLFDLIQEINSKYNGKKDISWFFDEWFYKTYKLDYSLKNIEYENINGKYYTTVTIENLEDAVMPAEVEITDVAGEKYKIYYEAEDFFNSGSCVAKSIVVNTMPVGAVIDPEMRLLDQNRLNNTSSLVPPLFFHINPLAEFLKFHPVDKYAIYWFPAFGFNNADGFKLGVNLDGSYMRNRKKINLTFMQGTKFSKNSFGADLTLGDRLGFIGKYATVSFNIFNYEGRRGASASVQNKWITSSPGDELTFNLSANYFDAYDDRYFNNKSYDLQLKENSQIPLKQRKYYWVMSGLSFRQTAGILSNLLKLDFESGFLKRNESLNIGYQKLTLTGSQAIWAQNKKILTIRQFLGYNPGELPLAKKYYLSTVNPVDEFSSYIYRSEGIISRSAREKKSVPWGDGYMRGYFNQNKPGNIITSFNSEIRLGFIFKPLPIIGGIINAISPLFFIDAGNTWGNPENIKFKDFLSDYGFSLKIPLNARFSGTNMLEFLNKLGINTISFDFPVYVSHPLPGESKFKFRWLFGFQTPI